MLSHFRMLVISLSKSRNDTCGFLTEFILNSLLLLSLKIYIYFSIFIVDLDLGVMSCFLIDSLSMNELSISSDFIIDIFFSKGIILLHLIFLVGDSIISGAEWNDSLWDSLSCCCKMFWNSLSRYCSLVLTFDNIAFVWDLFNLAGLFEPICLTVRTLSRSILISSSLIAVEDFTLVLSL